MIELLVTYLNIDQKKLVWSCSEFNKLNSNVIIYKVDLYQTEFIQVLSSSSSCSTLPY